MSKSFFQVYQWAAGTCDATTGLLLSLAPRFTLRLMGIQVPAEPVFVSFIGAFVFGVGLSYLSFSRPPRSQVEETVLRAVWQITGIQRLCVGSFVAGACASQLLESAWITVSLVDLSLGLFQLWGANARLIRYE